MLLSGRGNRKTVCDRFHRWATGGPLIRPYVIYRVNSILKGTSTGDSWMRVAQSSAAGGPNDDKKELELGETKAQDPLLGTNLSVL